MKRRLFIILLLCGAQGLHADPSLQLSLIPQIALYPSTTTVRGLSLGIWGQNPQCAFNLGLLNGSTGASSGFSLALVNYAESYHGVQFGAINLSTDHFVGWQNGYANISQGTFSGFQFGFVNVAEEATGFQLGAVNYVERLHGLQIGIINIARSNHWFNGFPDKLAPAFPLLNWSF